MLIDKDTVVEIIDNLIYLVSALEHNELDTKDMEQCINSAILMKNKHFCTCATKQLNNIKICPVCNKYIFIRWDGLTLQN